MDRILGRLAEDATATTYDAADAAGHRFVYTVGKAAAVDEPAYTAWARTLTEVSAHPRLATVHSGGVGADGRPYLVTGAGERTLAEALTTEPPGPEAVLTAIADAADGLAALHARGLRHGAVCASTILLDGAGAARLAGFDTRAPEMGLAATAGAFTAPEGDGGPPSDVYGLAAVAYTALGGVLPYAAAPGDPGLRRQQITDLPGVPGAVTGILRIALHPDPAARPSAGTLRDVLSAATVDAPAIAALPPTAVGAEVRPVNDTVVSINIAVAGAAAAGIAVAAAVVAAPAVATALTTAGSGAGKAIAAKGGAGALIGKIAVGVVGLAVVAAAVVIGVQALGNGGDGGDVALNPPVSPAPSQPPFDYTGLRFTEPGGGETITLTGGRFEKQGADQFQTYTWTLVGEPAKSDLDGDGDLDAVVALRRDGFETGDTYLTAFLWTDGAPAQAKNWADGICEVTSLTAEGKQVTAKLKATSPALGCYGPAQDALTDETVTFGLQDGWFAQTAPKLGAGDRCNFAPGDEPNDFLSPVTPRVAPDPASPEIPGDFTTIAYTTAGQGNWAVARLFAGDGTVSCGWIPLDAD
ncbi:hypothetical protein Afil01_50760 [Actinorhabdospora filicis]|uniref:non-specific serine/threonine protein kinase n=1 Tax=Actinorhabdospora filicis TaxID=1785913 RepID=A0A9W6WB45_9ACTN|nr:hypothetical protein [Actinorhabdospora filicis]GLZ80269.1 hypothetical protein Afil01_50760 [Actinorhabdospora filicis]